MAKNSRKSAEDETTEPPKKSPKTASSSSVSAGGSKEKEPSTSSAFKIPRVANPFTVTADTSAKGTNTEIYRKWFSNAALPLKEICCIAEPFPPNILTLFVKYIP